MHQSDSLPDASRFKSSSVRSAQIDGSEVKIAIRYIKSREPGVGPLPAYAQSARTTSMYTCAKSTLLGKPVSTLADSIYSLLR